MIIGVTGSSGFIGKKLIEQMEIKGISIIKIDISNGIDITNWNQLKEIGHFNILIHLAANSFVPHSYQKPREFYQLNINGVINGLELCRQKKARFIFVSSYVYGIPDYLPIDEIHPKRGINPYAETKIIGETICRNYFDYFGVSSIILRPFNIYGPGQNENFLISTILNQAKTGKIQIKDSRPKRDFVYIDDVVAAILKAIEFDTIEFDAFNIAFGKSHSVKELVNLVNCIYNDKLIIHYSEEVRENEVLDTVADISKARTVLGWKPTINLFQGLTKMVLDE